MNSFTPSHHTDAISQLSALIDRFPSGCDPDFDDSAEELERQFAELRLAIDHH